MNLNANLFNVVIKGYDRLEYVIFSKMAYQIILNVAAAELR